jgi:hypothetical protein
MVSQQERARLIQAYKNEPVYAAGLLIKSMVCLLVIGGVAVIGTQSDFAGDAASLQAQQLHHPALIITATAGCADHASSASAQQAAEFAAASESAQAPLQPNGSIKLAPEKSC